MYFDKGRTDPGRRMNVKHVDEMFSRDFGRLGGGKMSPACRSYGFFHTHVRIQYLPFKQYPNIWHTKFKKIEYLTKQMYSSRIQPFGWRDFFTRGI